MHRAVFADSETIRQLNDNGQVVLRYADASGAVTESANPNGSVENIAGIVNAKKNVFGLMPHPERCADPLWEESDGRRLFESFLSQAV